MLPMCILEIHRQKQLFFLLAIDWRSLKRKTPVTLVPEKGGKGSAYWNPHQSVQRIEKARMRRSKSRWKKSPLDPNPAPWGSRSSPNPGG